MCDSGLEYAASLVSKEVLFGRMKQHIETVVGRYKGKIYAWDVVNEVEPADGKPGGLRNSLWYQIAGEEFIEKAFEYAHLADPVAKLFINDYNTHQPQKRQFLHDLIKPVDGIGHQMHIDIQSPSVPDIRERVLLSGIYGLRFHAYVLIPNGKKRQNPRRPRRSWTRLW